MALPELYFDVVTLVISTLETSDLVSCSTISWSWYSASMPRLLRSITLSRQWDCTYWSDYLQRRSVFTDCILEMRIRGGNMQISSFLLNDVLAMCPNLKLLLTVHVNLARLERPINFQRPIEIRLRQCRFCSWGAATLLGYSDVTSLIVVRPYFLDHNTQLPVWYGPPRFVPAITVTRTSFSDAGRLFRCLPAHLLVFEKIQLDLIPGDPAPPPSTRIVLPSLGPAVRHLLIHTVGDLFPTSALGMVRSIPRDAPLRRVTLAAATFIDPTWSLVPASLVGFKRTIEMHLVYGCLPPNRDGLNSSPFVAVNYTTSTAFGPVTQYLSLAQELEDGLQNICGALSQRYASELEKAGVAVLIAVLYFVQHLYFWVYSLQGSVNKRGKEFHPGSRRSGMVLLMKGSIQTSKAAGIPLKNFYDSGICEWTDCHVILVIAY
ncbi:hypothetical protein ARMSODRAFT_978335 [Armillaria solidipes]|uniref:F-box domain-containing protein n=1 Tax=Armillaria solidipes TaxID=1076256 RepID=A0A2H3BHM5_9AGAR|nr:hypothetical protein ARMSODRAFT_978335 [Armillaria solidipes]